MLCYVMLILTPALTLTQLEVPNSNPLRDTGYDTLGYEKVRVQKDLVSENRTWCSLLGPNGCLHMIQCMAH